MKNTPARRATTPFSGWVTYPPDPRPETGPEHPTMLPSILGASACRCYHRDPKYYYRLIFRVWTVLYPLTEWYAQRALIVSWQTSGGRVMYNKLPLRERPWKLSCSLTTSCSTSMWDCHRSFILVGFHIALPWWSVCDTFITIIFHGHFLRHPAT